MPGIRGRAAVERAIRPRDSPPAVVAAEAQPNARPTPQLRRFSAILPAIFVDWKAFAEPERAERIL
jgi:hypothetical protein